MADEIARGIIRLDGDSSGYKAAMADAVQTAADAQQKIGGASAKMGQAAKTAGTESAAAAGQMDLATRRFIASLERQSQAAGRTRSEYLELRAAQRGVTAQAAPFIQRIRDAERNMGSLELSAKQTTAAMRLLPAQITDIVTGLVSGQPAYLVAIQQGGQIKDSFGGIIPAAKQLASLFTPLRVAMGAGAIAGFALIKAFRDGAAETEVFNRALITSGNVAGMTAGQLSVLAREVSNITGTQGQASEAMAGFVQTGQVANANLVRFTAIAIETQRRLGTAIEDTVKAYAELGRDPTKASERLNAEYRYLTLAVYEHIRALEEQGRRAEAGDAAQKAYANAQQERNRQLEAGLGDYQRAWEKLGNAAKSAWDWMLNIGREPDARSALAAAEERLRAMSPGGEGYGRFTQSEIDAQRQQVELLRKRADTTEDLTKAAAEHNRIQQAGIEGQKYLAQFESKEARRRAELVRFNAEISAVNEARRLEGREALSQAEIARMRQELLSKYKTSGKAYTDDAATRMLQTLRESEATLREQLDTESKIGAAARERIKFEQLIADLKNKGTLTADQKSLLASQDKIRAHLKTNEALETEVDIRKIIADQQKKELERQERFAERAAQIAQEIESAREGRIDQYGRQLGAFGLGDSERQRISDQASIFREFQRYQRNLVRATPEHMLGSAKYIQESMRIKAALDQALADHKSYYEQLRREQANWENGYRRAIQNYIDQVSDVSGQVESLLTNTFKGLEDLFTDFFTKGKSDWRSFGDSIVAEVTRIIVRTQMIQPIAQSLGGGGTGGMVASFLGSLFGGGVSPHAGSVFAKGGAFGPAGVEMFASGGVVGQPTLFGYGGNKVGMMGEAGYEAVMPLTRTPTGELGVKTAGAPAGGSTVVHMTVVTRDAESFRRSEGQIKSRLANMTADARRFT